MATVAKRIKTGLRKFADDLKSGKTVKATRLKKVEVNGVPAYLREEVSLRARRPEANIGTHSPSRSGQVGRRRSEPDTKTYLGRFAVRLNDRMKRQGISVKELADKLGVSETTVYDWLAARKEPNMDRYPALATALGLKKPGDVLPLE